MAWAKVDDQWFASRKVVPLTLAARGLWTTVLSWTCAQKTAHVPGHMAAFLAGDPHIDGEIEELVAVGLWHDEGHDCGRCDDPEPGGWVVHDWADYQEKTTSEKRAEAGAKGGRRSGETRRAQASNDKPEPPPEAPDEAPDEATPKQTDEANAKQTKQANEANDEAGTRPVPSRPDQEQNSLSTGVDPDDGFQHFWDVWPKRNGKKLAKEKARRAWTNLTVPERRAAWQGAKHYAAASNAGMAGAKDAFRWLQGREWPDWQDPARPDRPGEQVGRPTEVVM